MSVCRVKSENFCASNYQFRINASDLKLYVRSGSRKFPIEYVLMDR